MMISAAKHHLKSRWGDPPPPTPAPQTWLSFPSTPQAWRALPLQAMLCAMHGTPVRQGQPSPEDACHSCSRPHAVPAGPQAAPAMSHLM